jgi:type II secretory pathway component PulJ
VRDTRGTHHKIGTEAGTSLIELMFAMATGLVVMGATLQALSYFQQQFMRQQREVAQQQDLRIGLEVLERQRQWSVKRVCLLKMGKDGRIGRPLWPVGPSVARR